MTYDIVTVYYKDEVRYRVTGMNEDKVVVTEKIFQTKADAETYIAVKCVKKYD
jgi:hypothetical protein